MVGFALAERRRCERKNVECAKMSLQLGQLFESYEEFMGVLQTFQEATGHRFIKHYQKTAQWAALNNINPVPQPRLRYYRLKMNCSRKKESNIVQDCGSWVRLGVTKDGERLEVVALSLKECVPQSGTKDPVVGAMGLDSQISSASSGANNAIVSASMSNFQQQQELSQGCDSTTITQNGLPPCPSPGSTVQQQQQQSVASHNANVSPLMMQPHIQQQQQQQQQQSLQQQHQQQQQALYYDATTNQTYAATPASITEPQSQSFQASQRPLEPATPQPPQQPQGASPGGSLHHQVVSGPAVPAAEASHYTELNPTNSGPPAYTTSLGSVLGGAHHHVPEPAPAQPSHHHIHHHSQQAQTESDLQALAPLPPFGNLGAFQQSQAISAQPHIIQHHHNNGYQESLVPHSASLSELATLQAPQSSQQQQQSSPQQQDQHYAQSAAIANFVDNRQQQQQQSIQYAAPTASGNGTDVALPPSASSSQMSYAQQLDYHHQQQQQQMVMGYGGQTDLRHEQQQPLTGGATSCLYPVPPNAVQQQTQLNNSSTSDMPQPIMAATSLPPASTSVHHHQQQPQQQLVSAQAVQSQQPLPSYTQPSSQQLLYAPPPASLPNTQLQQTQQQQQPQQSMLSPTAYGGQYTSMSASGVDVAMLSMHQQQQQQQAPPPAYHEIQTITTQHQSQLIELNNPPPPPSTPAPSSGVTSLISSQEAQQRSQVQSQQDVGFPTPMEVVPVSATPVTVDQNGMLYVDLSHSQRQEQVQYSQSLGVDSSLSPVTSIPSNINSQPTLISSVTSSNHALLHQQQAQQQQHITPPPQQPVQMSVSCQSALGTSASSAASAPASSAIATDVDLKKKKTNRLTAAQRRQLQQQQKLEQHQKSQQEHECTDAMHTNGAQHDVVALGCDFQGHYAIQSSGQTTIDSSPCDLSQQHLPALATSTPTIPVSMETHDFHQQHQSLLSPQDSQQQPHYITLEPPHQQQQQQEQHLVNDSNSFQVCTSNFDGAFSENQGLNSTTAPSTLEALLGGGPPDDYPVFPVTDTAKSLNNSVMPADLMECTAAANSVNRVHVDDKNVGQGALTVKCKGSGTSAAAPSELYIGQIFKSYKLAEQAVENYAAARGYKYRKIGSMLLKRIENKGRLKEQFENASADPEIRYFALKFRCVRSRQLSMVSNYVKKKKDSEGNLIETPSASAASTVAETKTADNDNVAALHTSCTKVPVGSCNARITILLNAQGTGLEVKQLDETHDHPPNDELIVKYQERRGLGDSAIKSNRSSVKVKRQQQPSLMDRHEARFRASSPPGYEPQISNPSFITSSTFRPQVEKPSGCSGKTSNKPLRNQFLNELHLSERILSNGVADEDDEIRASPEVDLLSNIQSLADEIDKLSETDRLPTCLSMNASFKRNAPAGKNRLPQRQGQLHPATSDITKVGPIRPVGRRVKDTLASHVNAVTNVRLQVSRNQQRMPRGARRDRKASLKISSVNGETAERNTLQERLTRAAQMVAVDEVKDTAQAQSMRLSAVAAVANGHQETVEEQVVPKNSSESVRANTTYGSAASAKAISATSYSEEKGKAVPDIKAEPDGEDTKPVDLLGFAEGSDIDETTRENAPMTLPAARRCPKTEHNLATQPTSSITEPKDSKKNGAFDSGDTRDNCDAILIDKCHAMGAPVTRMKEDLPGEERDADADSVLAQCSSPMKSDGSEKETAATVITGATLGTIAGLNAPRCTVGSYLIDTAEPISCARQGASDKNNVFQSSAKIRSNQALIVSGDSATTVTADTGQNGDGKSKRLFEKKLKSREINMCETKVTSKSAFALKKIGLVKEDPCQEETLSSIAARVSAMAGAELLGKQPHSIARAFHESEGLSASSGRQPSQSVQPHQRQQRQQQQQQRQQQPREQPVNGMGHSNVGICAISGGLYVNAGLAPLTAAASTTAATLVEETGATNKGLNNFGSNSEAGRSSPVNPIVLLSNCSNDDPHVVINQIPAAQSSAGKNLNPQGNAISLIAASGGTSSNPSRDSGRRRCRRNSQLQQQQQRQQQQLDSDEEESESDSSFVHVGGATSIVAATAAASAAYGSTVSGRVGCYTTSPLFSSSSSGGGRSRAVSRMRTRGKRIRTESGGSTGPLERVAKAPRTSSSLQQRAAAGRAASVAVGTNNSAAAVEEILRARHIHELRDCQVVVQPVELPDDFEVYWSSQDVSQELEQVERDEAATALRQIEHMLFSDHGEVLSERKQLLTSLLFHWRLGRKVLLQPLQLNLPPPKQLLLASSVSMCSTAKNSTAAAPTSASATTALALSPPVFNISSTCSVDASHCKADGIEISSTRERPEYCHKIDICSGRQIPKTGSSPENVLSISQSNTSDGLSILRNYVADQRERASEIEGSNSSSVAAALGAVAAIAACSSLVLEPIDGSKAIPALTASTSEA